MREYIITTDSTTDLPDSYIEENNLPILPIYYSINDIVYGGELNLDTKEFYDMMRSGIMPTTMASNPDTAETFFREHLEKGLDILHVTLSSGLSSTFNTMTFVAKQLEEEYPDSKIIVIDSLCASMGEGLLVHKGLQLKKQGKSLEEVAAWLEDNRLNVCNLFTVDDLNHLHRGGRVSKSKAVIGTLINIKPVLHMDTNGKLVPQKNTRGRKKSLITLVDNMEKAIPGFEDQNDIVFISHGDCVEDAEFVARLIKERFGINDSLISYITPTVGAHSGPGTIALFFMGSPR